MILVKGMVETMGLGITSLQPLPAFQRVHTSASNLVDLRGVEPLTSPMRRVRSTN